MTGAIEKTYGKIFKYTLKALNPFKKAVVTTECKIHKLINIQALEIIQNDGFLDAYNFYSDFIEKLNEGVFWADQDFKSSGHFYNPTKGRGLYGNKNALSLATEYYGKAISEWRLGDIGESMFFLGAAAHLVQDMTVPQHANIRLFDDHRQYESFIKKTYMNTPIFFVDKGGYYLESIEEYIKCNARNAITIYHRLKKIENEDKRFYTIAKFTLPLAQRTTAGCFVMFYRGTSKFAGRTLRK